MRPHLDFIPDEPQATQTRSHRDVERDLVRRGYRTKYLWTLQGDDIILMVRLAQMDGNHEIRHLYRRFFVSELTHFRLGADAALALALTKAGEDMGLDLH